MEKLLKMFEYGGYAGKFLRLNLEDKKAQTTPLTKEMAKMFVGGNGFAAKLLYDELEPGIDPLGPKNKVIFAVGPVEGTIIPTSQMGVFTKSPLTNYFVDGYGGGYLSNELKFAGYDGIIVEGNSKNPIYVSIHDDDVEFKDASHLWGKDVFETQKILKSDLNNQSTQIACIGPSAELLVKISTVFWGESSAGRGGVGTVLGSKKLKAITVTGTKDVKVPDVEKVREYVKTLYEKITSNAGTGKALPTLGTPAVTTAQNQLGMLGTRNWQTEVFEDIEKISGTRMREDLVVKDRGCFSCPIRCKKYSYISKGPYKGIFTQGPQYETIWSLGSNCGVSSLEAITKANQLCNEFGMDTVSAGMIVSFAMECYERGILKKDDVNGLELRFGNETSMIELIEKIGKREGIGDLLAEGVVIASRKIGKGSEKYAIAQKGLELAGHSPRAMKGFALGQATSTRGGSHQDGRPTAERVGVSPTDRKTTERKAEYAIGTQRITTLQDSMIICRMLEGIYGLLEVKDEYLNTINIVTGMDLNLKELIDCTDRIINLERAFNCREGLRREHDVLAERFMTEPIPEGPSKGLYCPKEELEPMKDEYYDLMGWDKKTGIPSRDTLKRLGLNKQAEDLYK